jgi:hypothetical protein
MPEYLATRASVPLAKAFLATGLPGAEIVSVAILHLSYKGLTQRHEARKNILFFLASWLCVSKIDRFRIITSKPFQKQKELLGSA